VPAQAISAQSSTVFAPVRAARLLLVIAHAADYVRKVACRKAEAIAIEATAWCDARTRLTGGRGEGEWNAKNPWSEEGGLLGPGGLLNDLTLLKSTYLGINKC
jgi:hypothetical protein